MQPHQERVVEERLQLDIKVAALLAFFTTKLWDSLPEDEKDRLQRQLKCMQEYSGILGERIANFKN